jgi:flavin-dependent dehydrogenase
VVAQEVEFRVGSGGGCSFATANEEPELYFCHDLKGYGWCFRKGDYINLGLGRMDSRSLPEAHAAFIDFLKRRGRIPSQASWHPRGHAYLVSGPICREVVAPGLLLVGDAAALAYPQSGEGIRPAIESGLLAAATIVAARGCYDSDRLEPYTHQLRTRFAAAPISRVVSQALPGATRAAARWLLRQPWFVRQTVVDRWFLHVHEPALARS